MSHKIIPLFLVTLLVLLQGCATLLKPKTIEDVTANLPQTVPVVADEKLLRPVANLTGSSVVKNELGDVVVTFSKPVNPVALALDITREQDSQGNILTTVKSSNAEALMEDNTQLTIQLPEPAWVPQIIPTQAQFAQLRESSILSSSSPPITPLLPASSSYPLRHSWQKWDAYFWTSNDFSGGNRISSQIRVPAHHPLYLVSTLQTAAELSSNCDKQESAKCYKGKEPVLFIHGYTPTVTGLGGGETTWKNFPARLLELGKGNQYVVFEFRWLTAARFQDVAADLGRAIEEIAQATGRTVHLIAHSFGGLLIRTYLQGLATEFPYRGNVASVTTVGSPHSGITEADKVVHGTFFSRGQDIQGLLNGQLQINFCQQISCYQMGEYVNFTEEDLQSYQLNISDVVLSQMLNKPSPLADADRPVFDVPDELDLKDKPGKFISVLSDLDNYPLPKGLPVQVLIGLTLKQFNPKQQQFTKLQEGDGLISYAGQRFAPALTARGIEPLLNQDTRFGGPVTEKILGLPEVRPGEENVLPLNHPDYWGYRHTDGPVGFTNARPMVQVECQTIEKCDHATFQQVREWLQKHRSQKFSKTTSRLTIKMKVVKVDTDQPIPFAWVRVYRKNSPLGKFGGEPDTFLNVSQTDKNGVTTAKVEFTPNATYYLDVKAWGFEGITQVGAFTVEKRLKKSSFDVGKVKLAPKSERRQVAGKITDAQTGQPLAKVNYLLHDGDMWRLGNSDDQGNYVIAGLLSREGDVFFFKDGYTVAKLPVTTKPNQEQVVGVKMQRKVKSAGLGNQ
jgi:pimeloyl-ACP methyl ester carboxylesterase